uniref:Lysozyme n=1 Tax=Acrobeloides nanus TaxID=290746 RepID=A0A914EGG2_9BILA
MKTMFVSLIVFFLPLIKAQNFNGIETIVPTSLSQFQCLHNQELDYVFLRVGKADGTIDNIGLQNINNAYQAGFNEFGVQIVPFFVPNLNLNATSQVVAVKAALDNTTIKFDYLFADTTATVWSSDKTQNQQFLTALHYAIWNDGVNNNNLFVPGYYSSYSKWTQAFGTNFTVDPDVQPSLLWTQVTGYANATGFQQFGGWCKPSYHLWQPNANLCGVNLGQIWGDPYANYFDKKRQSKRNQALKKFKQTMMEEL